MKTTIKEFDIQKDLNQSISEVKSTNSFFIDINKKLDKVQERERERESNGNHI